MNKFVQIIKDKRVFLPIIISVIIAILVLGTATYFNFSDPPPDEQNILLVGLDKVAGLTDTIAIANYNSQTGQANIIQIPRDTYVASRKGKINAAYSHNVNNLIKVIKDVTGIKINKYIVVDIQVVRTVVDAIGGVEIDVPFDMKYDDPLQDLHIDLKKGKQVLDGKKAEMFVRFRKGLPRGDLSRMEMQRDFFKAIIKKVFSPRGLLGMPSTVKAIKENTDTDMSIEEMLAYGRSIVEKGTDNITFHEIPGKAVMIGQGSYFVIDAAEMERVTNQFFNFGQPIKLKQQASMQAQPVTHPDETPQQTPQSSSEPSPQSTAQTTDKPIESNKPMVSNTPNSIATPKATVKPNNQEENSR